MAQHLNVAASLVAKAQQVEEPYVQERTLTCIYSAVLIGGDDDLEGARSVLEAVSSWTRAGLPVDVLARDSVRGIAAWYGDRRLLDNASLSDFAPPYGATPPDEPPTREELEAACGPIQDAEGNYNSSSSSAIGRARPASASAPGLEDLGEDPLGPAIVRRFGGGDAAARVMGQTPRRRSWATVIGDVGLSGGPGMLPRCTAYCSAGRPNASKPSWSQMWARRPLCSHLRSCCALKCCGGMPTTP
jgi:hypothetical protein